MSIDKKKTKKLLDKALNKRSKQNRDKQNISSEMQKLNKEYEKLSEELKKLHQNNKLDENKFKEKELELYKIFEKMQQINSADSSNDVPI
jgi:predicted  nucleic acid-binding Zn-ribbon protein